MYIQLDDPENPGRRLYANLIITTVHSGENAKIVSIEVTDVASEATLAAAIAEDLRHVQISEVALLKNIMKEHYRVWHLKDELVQAVQAMKAEVI